MAEPTSDCAPGADAPAASASLPKLAPMNQLPTLQRNALRKIFDRPEFSAEEVAALGYRRLQQAEGIGQKGLSEIIAWLQANGFELKPLETAGPRSPAPRKTRKNIELAVRLLRTHGYLVQPADAAPLPGLGD